ncbi:4Fe-4S dicluster domain-containing protein [Solimonas sp. K1W22B-7]|uniref:4Fe-4S dicluster domain-containing protein n=1 Tax=Solimonas sp. K1W22B-7 TaxID=2303331 RepID=UPI000E330520|nr:4Fe-4S binding protein [Solimonas sp. K1W22B-7]AXQ31078.1 4Fe-4S dicluster domain-containing protein [Solimonas sp. K1W22B-7]
MPFVITSPCVADYSCVEVCPAGAISPTPDDRAFDSADQLYIDPTRCIDCEACVEACPVGAIFDSRRVPERWKDAIRQNAQYFEGLRHV